MEILACYGYPELALLYVGRTELGSVIEFVESVQPPLRRQDKWVLIISTLQGCPVRCSMCDAGGSYQGRLQLSELFEQIDAMVLPRFPDRKVPIPKFKVQFARMGEPTLNPAVLDSLRELPQRYAAPGLMPCISTVLPKSCENFVEKLINIKDTLYKPGRFQLQFSLHTTDQHRRHELIPYPVLSFADAARLGEAFIKPGDRKVALNFAAAREVPIEAEVLKDHFNPDIFAIKITPLNPTERGLAHGLRTAVDPNSGLGSEKLISSLQNVGYEVILSLGEPEEDQIGSNCGQYASRYIHLREALGA